MSKKPNIVFIITDQQRYDTIAAFGYPHVDTPNLDRLAREGVYLTSCFAAAASCVPARASLFTGYYPHTTGGASTTRHGGIAGRDLGRRLDCVNTGRGTPSRWAGFHARMIVENKDRSMAKRGRDFVDEWDKAIAKANFEKPGLPSYSLLNDYADRLGAFEWPLPKELHADTFVGGLAIDWIGRKASGKPFFLQVGFPGPHPPYDPPAEEAEPYLDRDLGIRPVAAGDIESQPIPFQQLVRKHVEGDHDAVRHKVDSTGEERHRQRAYYLANVTMIDREVGRILDALEAAGVLDDTIVVFTSDHGDMLGDHGHSQKWTMYEQVIRFRSSCGRRRASAGGARSPLSAGHRGNPVRSRRRRRAAPGRRVPCPCPAALRDVTRSIANRAATWSSGSRISCPWCARGDGNMPFPRRRRPIRPRGRSFEETNLGVARTLRGARR